MAQLKAVPVVPEPVTIAAQTSDWQEADFIRALASLERLQQQLDQLRKVPATLVAPFRTGSDSIPSAPAAPAPASSQHIFAAFHAARTHSFAQIASLRGAWEAPQTARLLQQCGRAQDKHVELVQRYGIGIWGWEERERELDGADAEGEKGVNGLVHGGTGAEAVRNTEEDERTACALFGPEFKQFEWDEAAASISVVVERPGPWLAFEVRRRPTAKGVAYEARCTSEGSEASAISRCLYKRQRRQDIFETLELLLAYGDVSLSRSDCSVCGKYRDGTGATPSARRRKARTKMGGQEKGDSPGWTSLHEKCL